MLTGELKWKNHPAVLMWSGYEKALSAYTRRVFEEWNIRGFKDTMWERVFGMIKKHDVTGLVYGLPVWFGNSPIHDNHKAKLLYKNKDHYEQFKWNIKPTKESYWPSWDGYEASEPMSDIGGFVMEDVDEFNKERDGDKCLI